MTPIGATFLGSLNLKQRAVLVELVSSGASLKRIAKKLEMPEQVLKNHAKEVYAKAPIKWRGARHRSDLTLFCFREGVVECPCKRQSE